MPTRRAAAARPPPAIPPRGPTAFTRSRPSSAATSRRSNPRRLAEELAHHRGFARIETLGVEGLVEPVVLVVEVEAGLVHERAQERAELHDLLALRRAHPQRDARRAAGHFVGLVQALQLPPRIRG